MTDRRTDLPKGYVDVPISAAGPSSKLVPNKDGTTHVVPGKAHEAREGVVASPGVRTVSTAGQGPTCPSCKRTGTLKVHMNKPSGQRIYCSHKECNYDQSKLNEGSTGVTTVGASVAREVSGGGVKVLRQTGPRG